MYPTLGNIAVPLFYNIDRVSIIIQQSVQATDAPGQYSILPTYNDIDEESGRTSTLTSSGGWDDDGSDSDISVGNDDPQYVCESFLQLEYLYVCAASKNIYRYIFITSDTKRRFLQISDEKIT